jgi:3-hydroxyisobutyrate dehydrogenase-like beta-hydroxyacid dehydrogenase
LSVLERLCCSGQSGGLEPSRLREILLSGPAASAFLQDVAPRLLSGDQLTTFGLDRVVEEPRVANPNYHQRSAPGAAGVPVTVA